MFLESKDLLDQSIDNFEDSSILLGLTDIEDLQSLIDDLSDIEVPLFNYSDEEFSASEDAELYRQSEINRKPHIGIEMTCPNELHGCPSNNKIMLPCDCSSEFTLTNNDDSERNSIAIPHEHLLPAIQLELAIKTDPDSGNFSSNSWENDHCYTKAHLKMRRPAPIGSKVCKEKSDFDPGYVDVETISDDDKSENDRLKQQLKRTYKKKTTNTGVDHGKVTYPSTSRTTTSKRKLQHLSNIKKNKRKKTTNSSLPSHESSSSSSSSRSSSESEDIEKRSMHNTMERMRRENQRDLFSCLRQCIPSLKDFPKASKVTILSKADECIEALTKLEHDNQKIIKYELQETDRLNKISAIMNSKI